MFFTQLSATHAVAPLPTHSNTECSSAVFPKPETTNGALHVSLHLSSAAKSSLTSNSTDCHIYIPCHLHDTPVYSNKYHEEIQKPKTCKPLCKPMTLPLLLLTNLPATIYHGTMSKKTW